MLQVAKYSFISHRKERPIHFFTMILEELVGSFVCLCSSVIAQTPPIAREQKQFRQTFEETDEQDEVHDGLVHREYQKGHSQSSLIMNTISPLRCRLMSYNLADMSPNRFYEV